MKRHTYGGTYIRMDIHGRIYVCGRHTHKVDKGYTNRKIYIQTDIDMDEHIHKSDTRGEVLLNK